MMINRSSSESLCLAHGAALLYYVYVVMMISLSLLKSAHMAFYLIDLQADFCYTVFTEWLRNVRCYSMKENAMSRDIFSEEELEASLKEFYKNKKGVRQGSNSDCIVFGPPTNIRSNEERYRLVSERCSQLGVPVPEYYRRLLCD